MSDAQSAPAGGQDRRRAGSSGNAAGHGEQILPRLTLTLKRKSAEAITAVEPATDKPVRAGDPEPVPDDAAVSFCNWRVGHKRPTRRYLTAEAAFTEARRLRASFPGAEIRTFRLQRIEEVQQS